MSSVQKIIVSMPTRVRFYKARAKPTLSYVSESGTARVTDQRRLVSAEVIFMRTVGDNLSVIQISSVFTSNEMCRTVQTKLKRMPQQDNLGHD